MKYFALLLFHLGFVYLSYFFKTESGIFIGANYYIGLSLFYFIFTVLFLNKSKFTPRIFVFILGLLYLGSSPIFENDHYRYIWEGKVLSSGENPYVDAPVSKDLDFIKYSKRKQVGYPTLSSIYPPFAQFVFFLVSPLKYEYAMLCLQFIFYLLLLWIVPFWFKDANTYFFLILPFLIKEFIQSVHIDLIAVVLFSLCLRFRGKKRFHLFMLLSFLTKILSIISLPYYFLKDSSKKRVFGYSLTPILLLLFLYFNHSSNSGSSEFIKRWHWNSFLMDMLLFIKVPAIYARLVLLASFCFSYPYLLYRSLKNENLLITLFASFLLFSPVLHPWYFLWLIPLVRVNKLYYWAIASSVFAYAPYGASAFTLLGTVITFCLLLFSITKDLKNSKSKNVICMFSKTPGVSPVKTRIAKDLGSKFALDFFTQSIKVSLEEINKFDMDVVVAVADDVDNNFWKSCITYPQVEGSLGDRLAFIYDKLHVEYENVYFVGADAFHLDYKKIERAIIEFECSSFDNLLGKTEDGGFYIFGSKLGIENSVWLNVKYSVKTTSNELLSSLDGQTMLLDVEFDLDTKDDLKKLKSIDLESLSLAQVSLINKISNKRL